MSKEKKINLSGNFSIPAIEYAIEANAILGIRNSGKTFTAMKVAEDLMDASIPIAVFDPIGMWKNLKIGIGKFKGYPIVVAGGDETCDIQLTVSNAKEIMRAAMKENISIVFDFYSTALAHKATWIKITQEVIEVLLYENKNHGLRHIILEEAAEMIPQRLQPQHSRVYAAIESLARMGRNAGLGMTIINQRAEEVNKAILEICVMSLLHKQVGKNSLISIEKWLDIRQISNVSKMMKSIPQLSQGECWVVGMGETPVLVKIGARKTHHPSPNKVVPVKTSLLPVDVSKFVDKMNALLKPKEAPKTAPVPAKGIASKSAEPDKLTGQLRQEVADLKDQLKVSRARANYLYNQLKAIMALARPMKANLNSLLTRISHIESADLENKEPDKSPESVPQRVPEHRLPEQISRRPERTVTADKASSGAHRMLQAAAMFYPNAITKKRMCAIAGMKPTSGSTATYISSLKSQGLLQADGSTFLITAKGLETAGPTQPIPTGEELIEFWKNQIGETNGAGRMLIYLGRIYPLGVTKDDLAMHVNMSNTSGSFATYLSKLKGYDLLDTSDGKIKLSEEFFG